MSFNVVVPLTWQIPLSSFMNYQLIRKRRILMKVVTVEMLLLSTMKQNFALPFFFSLNTQTVINLRRMNY